MYIRIVTQNSLTKIACNPAVLREFTVSLCVTAGFPFTETIMSSFLKKIIEISLIY